MSANGLLNVKRCPDLWTDKPTVEFMVQFLFVHQILELQWGVGFTYLDFSGD